MAKGTGKRASIKERKKSLPPLSFASIPGAAREVCLEVTDYSVSTQSAVSFFGMKGDRNAAAKAARLAEQFVRWNSAALALMDVSLTREFDGDEVYLTLHSGSSVGAIPLTSPTSAQTDYGLVVQPRFPWAGVGPMLAEMGWRIAPTPLRLPLLKRSERRVPAWVLSSMVLVRLHALLRTVNRRFETVSRLTSAPRGRVDWQSYASQRLSRGQPNVVPCTFPDLVEDKRLLGGVRHVIECHVRSLDTQRQHGAHVHRLIEYAQALLRQVHHVAPVVPGAREIVQWMHQPMRRTPFLDGIQAIEWTVEDRGLAGVSDLEGIPWRMPMEQFFEAWVETVFTSLSQQCGFAIQVGRKEETRQVLRWRPPYDGAQRSLLPDLRLEREDLTVIVDAKYKRHWEEWPRDAQKISLESIREDHRHDFHQILAYANLSRSPRTIACLCYPCSPESWRRMEEERRNLFVCRIPTIDRDLTVWITAIPMAASVDEVAQALRRRVEQVADLAA